MLGLRGSSAAKRAHTALAENQCSVSSTLIGQLIACISSSRGSEVPGLHEYLLADAHTHRLKVSGRVVP